MRFIGVFGWMDLWKENWWAGCFLPGPTKIFSPNWEENMDANKRPILPLLTVYVR